MEVILSSMLLPVYSFSIERDELFWVLTCDFAEQIRRRKSESQRTRRKRESTKREKDSVQTLRKSFLRQRSQLGRKQTAVKARAKATEVTWVESWRGGRGRGGVGEG